MYMYMWALVGPRRRGISPLQFCDVKADLAAAGTEKLDVHGIPVRGWIRQRGADQCSSGGSQHIEIEL